MLQLKEIMKSYTTGEFTQVALNKVSLSFGESEFVAILGQSGSGKTTFLNVIGGLDQYDSGELIINGASTKKYKGRDWDAYRNNSVGFIFQNYNLIPHLGIIDNVEMGMTLSGVSHRERRKKAIDVLDRVGLKDHIHKKPNQLSGGQMQRVAIARALANNPDIILADEPTGALDTQTSEQIMELIREIAKDKLVVMVTHNPEIAEKYADRIIRFKDGEVISDSNPLVEQKLKSDYKLKKTSMSFLTALKLSGKNILTKKGRTALTSFASSIGIIGIAIILSLSNGFDKQIKSFETGSLSNFPITISQTAMSMDMAQMSNRSDDKEETEFPNVQEVYPYDSSENTIIHTNILTQEYVDYLSKIDQSLLDGSSYIRSVNMNILKMSDGKAIRVNLADIGFTAFPTKSSDKSSAYLEEYYDLLSGQFPQSEEDIVLILDEQNRMNTTALEALGFDYKQKSIDFTGVVGKEYKLILNNDFYAKSGDLYAINGDPSDLSDLYDNSNAITLKISGIIRIKDEANVSALSSGLAYSDNLAQRFIQDAMNSEIVKAQKGADYNILTGEALSENSSTTSGYMGGGNGMGAGNYTQSQTREEVLDSLGASLIPTSIELFPLDYDSKSEITDYLDQWNVGLDEKNSVEYTDMAAIVTNLSKSIMDAITLVLIAFAAISLVVSLIMIGIITWISVLERTKEIGVLRALGARKKDISRVFNAETFIVGMCSGVLGVSIAFALTFPINSILYKMTELSNVAQLNPLHAIALVIISLLLTLLGGSIPAKLAAKKDPIEALRSE
jgi:putative ABC transport system permease protein